MGTNKLLAKIASTLLLSNLSGVLAAEPSNAPSSVEQYEQLAKQGNGRANAVLASIHRWGELGTLQNTELATQYTMKSLELGSPIGATDVLVFGLGTPETKSKAQQVLTSNLERLKKDASRGDPRSAIALALVHQNALTGQKDSKEAVRWMGMAADKLPVASFFLGLYIETRMAPSQKGETKLLERYRFAADGGVGLAALRLAEAYRAGDIAERDDSKSRHWCIKGAKLNNAGAQTLAAWMLIEGFGGPRDFQQGIKYYKAAAAQQDAQACFGLGVLYENGEVVTQSYEQAASWYAKAAKLGHAKAQCNMGWMCEEGIGLPRDIRKAESWYRKAAAGGDVVAECNLVRLLVMHGTPADMEEADALLRSAASKGEPRAMQILTQMNAASQFLNESLNEADLKYQIETQTQLEFAEKEFRERFGK